MTMPSPVNSPVNYEDFGSVTKANLKSTPGSVVAVAIYNKNATIRYFQLHNKATVPVATDVPAFSFPIPAGTANNPGILIFDSAWFAGSYYLTNGIGWAVSTTDSTFTDSATASDHGARVRYV